MFFSVFHMNFVSSNCTAFHVKNGQIFHAHIFLNLSIAQLGKDFHNFISETFKINVGLQLDIRTQLFSGLHNFKSATFKYMLLRNCISAVTTFLNNPQLLKK